jgi:hypothetical protein
VFAASYMLLLLLVPLFLSLRLRNDGVLAGELQDDAFSGVSQGNPPVEILGVSPVSQLALQQQLTGNGRLPGVLLGC